VERQALGDGAAPAAVDIQLDIAQQIGAAVVDRTAPGADVEPALVGYVDSALDRRVAARPRSAAEAAVADDRDVAGHFDRAWRVGLALRMHRRSSHDSG